MDILLALLFAGILSIAVLLVISAYLICQQIDYHIALHNWAMRQQATRQHASKRIIEIHIG